MTNLLPTDWYVTRKSENNCNTIKDNCVQNSSKISL